MQHHLHNVQINSSAKMQRFASSAVLMADESCDICVMNVNLRKIRKQQGLGQDVVAERSGFSISQISRWETGASNIPSDKLSILAASYGCSVKDIFDEDETLISFAPSSNVKSVDDNPELLEVVGFVSAGIWREREELDVGDRYTVPANTKAYSGYKRAILMVDGHSMNLVFPHGTALTVVYTEGDLVEPVHNDYVIVRRNLNGLHETTVKKLVMLEDGNRELRCESDRPEFADPVYVGKPDKDHITDDGIEIIAIVLTATEIKFRRGDVH